MEESGPLIKYQRKKSKTLMTVSLKFPHLPSGFHGHILHLPNIIFQRLIMKFDADYFFHLHIVSNIKIMGETSSIWK